VIGARFGSERKKGDHPVKVVLIVLSILVLSGGIILCLRWPAPEEGGGSRFTEEESMRYSRLKEAALERILGPMHEWVGHAVIPFQVGGAVDMYYFPDKVPGTGFATMELIEPDGSGPKPNRIGTYELLAFTRHRVPASAEKRSEDDPFHRIERRICGIFTCIGNYSYEAVLNPGDTCEAPWKEGEPSSWLIFDAYGSEGAFEIDGRKHCLLLCIEVFRSEMEYAMAKGSAAVIRKLKEAGHYPFSDLDREPVY